MNITLNTEQSNFVQKQLKEGRYKNADEIISAALQLLSERQRFSSEKRIEELRQKIAIGTEQIAKGKVTDGEFVFARLQEKIYQFSDLQQ
jgi:antitoxin ParD1/3/4